MKHRDSETTLYRKHDKQLQGVTLESVMEKRRLDQALNAKEFAVCAGVSYSTARNWFHLPDFSRFSRSHLLAGFPSAGASIRRPSRVISQHPMTAAAPPYRPICHHGPLIFFWTAEVLLFQVHITSSKPSICR